MAKFFCLATLPETRWVDDHSKPGYTPVLNDKFPRGDIVHVDFDAAWTLAQDIAYSLNGAKGLAVYEIEIDEAAIAALERTGDITENPQADAFGARLRKLSLRACSIINHAAAVKKHDFLIPEGQLRALSGIDRETTATILQ